MITLGIELCDDGVIAAVSDSENEPYFLGLEKDQLASPAAVYFDGDRYICGKEAQNLNRIYPRLVSDTCWDQLSLRDSAISSKERTPLYSELAYHHFKHIWTRIKASAIPFDRVVMALPGNYLSGNSEIDEKIGLILGIAQDCEVPLCCLMDMAVASSIPQISQFAGKPGPVYHLDIHQHMTLLTEMETGGTLSAKKNFRIPNLGWAQIMGDLLPRLSNQFLSQTAFDVTHDTETEQEFYDKATRLVYDSAHKREATLEITSMRRARKMMVSRDLLARLIEGISSRILDVVEKTIDRQTSTKSDEPISLILTDRSLRVPGLLRKIRNKKRFQIVTLAEGSAAEGAITFGSGMPLVGSLDETPTVLSFEYGELLKGTEKPPVLVGLPTLGKENESEDPKSIQLSENSPSHIVYKGIAYELGDDDFIIGHSNPAGQRGINLPKPKSPSGALQCRLVRTLAGLVLESPKTVQSITVNGVPIKGSHAVSSGDRIALGSDREIVELMLINLA